MNTTFFFSYDIFQIPKYILNPKRIIIIKMKKSKGDKRKTPKENDGAIAEGTTLLA